MVGFSEPLTLATPTLQLNPIIRNGARRRPSTAADLFDDGTVKLYRNNEHFPGYTGHVPKLCQTFGTRFTVGTRFALQAPPAPASRPVSAYDTKRGRRVIQTPYLLPGSTFSGLAEPTGANGRGEESEGEMGMHKYLQGSHVDVPSYYDTLRASNYDKLLIKSGFPDKARSHVEVGDRFYFNGPHMWQTTYKESFENDKDKKKGGKAPPIWSRDMMQRQQSLKGGMQLLGASQKQGVKEKAYSYKVLQALVGPRRLDHLEKQIRNKLSQLTNSGRHEAYEMFKVYDDDHTGTIGPDRFMRISRSLGIHISSTEAGALFGRFDKNRDDAITFYEFLDTVLGIASGEKVETHKEYY